jgi:hypothetical protein
MRQLALLVVATLLGWGASAHADEAVPVDAARLFIAQSYEHLAEFSVTALKQFPDGTTGTGRASIAGTATVLAPTYVPTKGIELELQFDGFTAEQMEYYGLQLGVWARFRHAVDAVVYDTEFRAGSVRPFGIELRYRETASGFRFILESSSLQIRGVPLGGLPTGAMIVGDKAFNDLVGRFIKAKVDRLAALDQDPLRTLRSDVRNILANENGIGHMMSTEGDALLIDLVDPSQKARAVALLQRLQAELVDSGSTLELVFGETVDGTITIRVKGP